MPDNKFKLSQTLKAISAVKTTVPKLLANQARNYFVKSWDLQGFDGKKWAEVQRRTPGTYAYEYPKKRDLGRRKRAILVGGIYNRSGVHLRSAVANSVRIATFRLIRLQVDLPYAAAQNEGTKTIPARPYMKHTATLGRMQTQTIETAVNKAFKI